MIEHCIAAYKQRTEQRSYQIYITDALKAISENTTYHVGFEGLAEAGAKMNRRWSEILKPKDEEKQEEQKKEDTRSCEEITAGIWERARI